MAKSAFQRASVRAIVTAVPERVRSIDDDLDLFGGNRQQIERIKQVIGLDRRRVVDDGVTTADLCAAAAERLFARSSLERAAVDALICVTQTPDHSQPCNAALLQHRLGLSSACAALDVNLGCSGYVYGLWLASMMVESGAQDTVLVLAGDTISRIVHPRDRAVAPIFGDGGSATLVTGSADAAPSWYALNTDGSGARHLIVPAGGARQPCNASTAAESVDEADNVRSAENLFMNGSEIFNFTITTVPDAVQGILAFAGMEADAIDGFIFHQANRYVLSRIAKRLKLPEEKVPMAVVEQFGNQSSASIPCAMCFEWGAKLTAAPQRLLLCGFGVGLSWASAVLSLGPLEVCEVLDLAAPEAGSRLRETV